MEEFGSNDYEKVTMDSICSKHGISKGMMYHYYSGKDELFLLCAKETFLQLSDHISRDTASLNGQDAFEIMQNYFLTREYFFREHPKQKNIFENALFHTPKHLREEIQVLRKPLRELNQHFQQRVIEKLKLRPELDTERIFRYLEGIDYVFWTLVEQYSGEKRADLQSFEEAAKQVLNMVLFGVARQGNVFSGMEKER